MKMNSLIKVISLSLVIMLIFGLVGCSSSKPEPAKNETGGEEETKPEATITSMSIGTASVGGALYAFGGGFVNVGIALAYPHRQKLPAAPFTTAT